MCTRTSIFLLFFGIAAIFIMPLFAQASSPFRIAQFGIGPLPMIPGVTYGTYQTALKAGDQNQQITINVQSFSSVPVISADLSQIGFLSPTTTPLSGTNNPYHYYINGIDYFPDWFFKFWPLIIGTDVTDGLKTMYVTATDPAGNVATATAQVLIDNVPPTISLTDISFSTTSPKKGDTMYLSGTADGTGSALTVARITETIWDAEGKPIWGYGFGNEYKGAALTAAIAISINGPFTRVPYIIIDSVPSDISTAATVNIAIIAYDGSGHIVTTNLTVPVPKAPPPDPCAVPGACASNVLFLPGIEASRLYEGTGCGKTAEEKLWEPFESSWNAVRGVGDGKVSNLSLNLAGDSVCSDIYTKEGDIIGSVGGSNIYKSFVNEMNRIKTGGTINDWEPVAYDWRLSLDDLLNNGAERGGKIYYEESTSTPYIEQTLRALAASSKTGKVTIIAHSNGGLVTKALLNKLGDTEAAKLVDKVIMVGVPQTGTPADIGATLVGYDAGIYQNYFPIVSNAAARSLAQNSPMAYHLLPSEDYLESTAGDSTHPVIRFAGAGYIKEKAAYGSTIANRVALADFLLAKEGGRVKPQVSDISSLEILNPTLIAYANSTHATLDYWIPPAGIEVDQIAGWGVDTVAGIDFYTPPPINAFTALNPQRMYKPIFTEDGDGTVTVPSAIMMATIPNVKRYWLNLDSYRIASSIKRTHRDLLEIPSLQDFIKNIIKNNTSTLPSYISSDQPPSTSAKKLTFFLHSPLTLQLTDSSGNVTGLATDDSVTQDIHGSTYGEFGEVKYVTVPEGGVYQLTMHGQASGTFSLDTQETSGGVVTTSSTIEGVPTTASTVVSMDIQIDMSTLSPMNIDKNGDGTIDAVITPKLGGTVIFDTTPPELQVTFSTTTKSIAFIGTDDSGAVTITSTTTYPAPKKNQKEKEYHGTTTTTVTARDAAGNTTKLVYTEQLPSPVQRDMITLRAISYGSTGSPQATSSLQAAISYKWRIKNGSFNIFASNLRNATTTLESHYRPKKNKTLIMTKSQDLDDSDNDDGSDIRPTKLTLPGMVVPYMSTEKGSLIVGY